MGQINPKNLVLAIQSPRDAVYGLFLGDEANTTFDPEKLTVIDIGNGYSETAGVFFDLAIIGESHFVRLIRDADSKVLFTELLACVDPLGLGFRPSTLHRFQEADSFTDFQEDKGLGLTVKTVAAIQPKTRNRRNFVPKSLLENDDVLAYARLKREFPGPLKPRTIVSVMLFPNYLEIKTVHEYVTADDFIEPLTSETLVTFNS